MKFSYSILAVFFFFSSCSKVNQNAGVKDFTATNFPQKWKLVKMTGSLQGSESTGQDMSWQETYVFNADGSFVKTRMENGETTSASGEYKFQEKDQAYISTTKKTH